MQNVSHRFVFTTQIGKVCDTTSTRYALGSLEAIPAVDLPGQAFVCATDTRVLAISQVEGDCPNPVLIPASIVPKVGKKTASVEMNGRWENSEGKFAEIDPEPGRFPKVEDVLPDLESDKREYLHVCLDAEYLLTLAKAINLPSGKYSSAKDSVVTLLLPVPTKAERESDSSRPFAVDSTILAVGNAGIGVCMPCSVNTNDDRTKFIETRTAYVNSRKAAFPAAE